MAFGVRAFIFLVFAITALSFLATTAVLVWEFWSVGWLTIANFYSHLFIFFPTFGIVTLIAFYTPACVFLDMYMRHVPWGRQRFLIGFLVAAALSLYLSNQLMSSQERSIFEVKPAVLKADLGEPPNCAATGTCERLPVLQAVDNVRHVSQSRIGVADLARNCRPDSLKDLPAQTRRYCFVTTPLPEDRTEIGEKQRIADEDCCRAQARFTRAVKTLHDSNGRSLTSYVHAALLPFKIFFAVVLLVISIMLAVRRKAMEQYYSHYLPGIERGVLVGAIAMVVYPIMSHAFLQSAALLYFGGGPQGGFRSVAPMISFLLGCWGLLILFFFYSRRDQEMQNLARMGGMIGSAVAVVKYDQIIDFSVRLFGSGASWINIAILCAAAGGALVALLVETTREHVETEIEEAVAALRQPQNDE